MAESKRRHGKLKGVVLVMVVTIMFVLMIMLLATLAVVSSTTKRTYNKYEENQAYYTSRSVLEVFIKNYLEDKTNLGEAGTTSPTTALSEVCGTLLPKHFTDVVDYTRSTTDPDDPGLNAGSYYVDFAGAQATNGFYFQQQIFGNLYPKYEWKFDEQGNPNGAMLFSDDKYWEMRTDVSTDNAASIAAKPYSVEFEVSLPELTGTGDSDAGLFANRKGGTGAQTSKIKVELLRVMFVTEDMSQWTDFMKSGTDVGSSTTADGKIDFKTVNWDKTYYRLKVSATTNLGTGDEESDITVSVILEPTQKATTPMGGPENAMTSFDSTEADNKIAIIGGAALSKAGGTTEFSNDASLVGNIVYNSNFRITAASNKWAYGEGESMVIHGGWLSTLNATYKVDGFGALATDDATVLSNRPFIFAQGAKFFKTTVGSNTNALDVVCGDPMNTGTDRAFKDEADLSGANVPDDYKDTVAFVTTQDGNKFYGDVYVDGDMYLSGNGDEFFGNVFCTGNIYVAYDNSGQGPKFHKEVHCGDVYSGSNVASSKNSFLQTGASYSTASSFSVKWPNPDNYVKETDPDGKDHAGQAKFTLPRRGDIYCGTSKQIESAYTYKALKIDVPSGMSEDDVVRAQDYFRYAVGNENAKLDISSYAKDVKTVYTASFTDKYNTYDSVSVLDTSGAPKSEAGFLQCALNLSNFDNKVYFINAQTDPIQFQLTTDGFGNMTAHAPTFIVVGDKSVVFTVADNTNYNAGSMAVYNSQIYSMINKNEKMYVGSAPTVAGTPAAPQIQYFIGDNSKFNFSNPGNFALCGYIYGGYASIEFGSQTNGDAMHRATLNYNGVELGTRDHCSFFGSAVFKSIKFQQIETLVFIDPNNKDKSGGSNAGGRIVWGRQRYLNRN